MRPFAECRTRQTEASILLNGVLGKSFNCKRDVCQGDPLLPLLFVGGSQLLQTVINKGIKKGRLQLPILCGGYLPVIQCAHDTILINASLRESIETP
jgi:hypothetical protein